MPSIKFESEEIKNLWLTKFENLKKFLVETVSVELGWDFDECLNALTKKKYYDTEFEEFMGVCSEPLLWTKERKNLVAVWSEGSYELRDRVDGVYAIFQSFRPLIIQLKPTYLKEFNEKAHTISNLTQHTANKLIRYTDLFINSGITFEKKIEVEEAEIDYGNLPIKEGKQEEVREVTTRSRLIPEDINESYM